jgi:hypothetical protein
MSPFDQQGLKMELIIKAEQKLFFS